MKVYLIFVRSEAPVSTPIMPLGILYVAAVFEKMGFQIRVFDNLYDQFSQAFSEIRKFKPDLIGVSFLTTEYQTTKNLIAQLRQIRPQALYFAGGIHITNSEPTIINDLKLDFAIYGEAEQTVANLCQKLAKKQKINKLPGVIWKNSSGQITKNLPQALINNLNTLPFPARHLLPTKKYFLPPGAIRSFFAQGTLTLISSRGCPFNCSFCNSHTLFGRKTRRRTVNNVIQEIESCQSKFVFDSLYFLDDTFTLNQLWVDDFCRAIKPTKLKWGCQTRVDLVNKDLLRKMKESGCVQVDFGIESGSEKILKKMKKGISVKQISQAFNLCREIGLRTYATAMIGYPGEKKNDLLKTFSLVKKIKPNFLDVTIAVPYPGTELYSLAEKNQWLEENGIAFFDWDGSNTREPILRGDFSAKELLNFKNKLQKINFWRNYSVIVQPKNLHHSLKALWAGIKNPKNALGTFTNFVRYKNFDTLVMYFLKSYQTSLLKQ